MKKKCLKLLMASSAILALAACSNDDNETVAYSNESEKSGQVKPIVESNESKKQINESSEVEDDSSVDENQVADGQNEVESTASEFSPEEESIISEQVPEGQAQVQSETDETSSVESTDTDEEAPEENYDNARASELLAEAAPLIHEASDDVFKAEGYVFIPMLLNDNLVQIDVRKQAPDDQNHSNLITIYRYDSVHGHLMEQNIVDANWKNVTPS